MVNIGGEEMSLQRAIEEGKIGSDLSNCKVCLDCDYDAGGANGPEVCVNVNAGWDRRFIRRQLS